ncbi:bacteriohemerythrin [Magnetovibrio sp.]|uniref:bacteriohemerythrin n=1 Tax=Magnetovibrio sp. TaxID=2024836 RepID=UPI002F94C3FB
MLVEWTSKLETGVTFVDADHKVLINLLNQVNDCISDNEESTVLGSVLDALVEYTDYHFLREEKMMELSGYSGLETHKTTHRVLSGQVRAVYEDFQASPWNVDPVHVRDFLQSWLVDHIMGSDFAYRDTCLNNAAASDAAGQVGFLGDGVTFNEWEHLRVMLVDDNPNFCRLIRTILRAVGIRNIQIVDNAAEGISRLADRPADVVLCDWVMDDMNGTEFARRVGEMQLPTRVVMLTGYSTDVLKERSSDLMVADYLEKPIKARNLLETISRVAMVVPFAAVGLG